MLPVSTSVERTLPTRFMLPKSTHLPSAGATNGTSSRKSATAIVVNSGNVPQTYSGNPLLYGFSGDWSVSKNSIGLRGNPPFSRRMVAPTLVMCRSSGFMCVPLSQFTPLRLKNGGSETKVGLRRKKRVSTSTRPRTRSTVARWPATSRRWRAAHHWETGTGVFKVMRLEFFTTLSPFRTHS